MKVIIPCAGFGTRFSGVPKPLLNLKNGETILDRLLQKVEGHEIYLITNALSNHLYEDKYSHYPNIDIYCNGLLKPCDDDGCLMNIQDLIELDSIEDDILIMVGDIIFDFPLDPLFKKFRRHNTIIVPVKKCSDNPSCDCKLSGGVIIDKYGYIDHFKEHEDLCNAEYYELGIYFISKNYLSKIKDCVDSFHKDAPGYLIEFLHKNVATYAIPVNGNWHHIVKGEDYEKYLGVDPDL